VPTYDPLELADVGVAAAPAPVPPPAAPTPPAAPPAEAPLAAVPAPAAAAVAAAVPVPATPAAATPAAAATPVAAPAAAAPAAPAAAPGAPVAPLAAAPVAPLAVAGAANATAATGGAPVAPGGSESTMYDALIVVLVIAAAVALSVAGFLMYTNTNRAKNLTHTGSDISASLGRRSMASRTGSRSRTRSGTESGTLRESRKPMVPSPRNTEDDSSETQSKPVAVPKKNVFVSFAERLSEGQLSVARTQSGENVPKKDPLEQIKEATEAPPRESGVRNYRKSRSTGVEQEKSNIQATPPEAGSRSATGAGMYRDRRQKSSPDLSGKLIEDDTTATTPPKEGDGGNYEF